MAWKCIFLSWLMVRGRSPERGCPGAFLSLEDVVVAEKGRAVPGRCQREGTEESVLEDSWRYSAVYTHYAAVRRLPVSERSDGSASEQCGERVNALLGVLEATG